MLWVGEQQKELMFSQRTTGASDDINKATDIARKMVCQWGMSDAIGPLSLDDKSNQEVFLGRDFKQGSHLSEEVTSLIDKEVSRLVTEGYRKALQVLKDNKEILIRMAEALLIKETLGAKELEAVMLGENIVSSDEKKAYEERIRTKPQNIYELLGDKFAEKTDNVAAPSPESSAPQEADSV